MNKNSYTEPGDQPSQIKKLIDLLKQDIKSHMLTNPKTQNLYTCFVMHIYVIDLL